MSHALVWDLLENNWLRHAYPQVKTLYSLSSIPCLSRRAWVACEVEWVEFGWLVIIMECSRIWSVGSKEFEVLIKGGAIGVRIVERSIKKQRSIFVQKDELAWLVGSVEEVVDVEMFEIFWDQSRVGYPRIIAQKCSNRHGRFLTIEEFDGRRRSGTVLIPERRYGQG